MYGGSGRCNRRGQEGMEIEEDKRRGYMGGPGREPEKAKGTLQAKNCTLCQGSEVQVPRSV